MARTLEQILKARGYSDAEMASLSPMLSDPRFRKSLEDEIGETDVIREKASKLEKDLNDYDTWFNNELTPDYTKQLKEKEDAIAENAALKARLDLQTKRGLAAVGRNQDPAAVAEQERIEREASDAARKALQPGPDYVDRATFQGAFEATGSAIAGAVNLARQHEKLFGADADLDMEVLYSEAKAAKMPVKAYWERKYHVAEKRTEIAAKQQEERDNRIRQDERQKLQVEFGMSSNPNLRNLVPSNNPFISRSKIDGGKHPWEKSETELTNARIQKAVEKAASRGEM